MKFTRDSRLMTETNTALGYLNYACRATADLFESWHDPTIINFNATKKEHPKPFVFCKKKGKRILCEGVEILSRKELSSNVSRFTTASDILSLHHNRYGAPAYAYVTSQHCAHMYVLASLIALLLFFFEFSCSHFYLLDLESNKMSGKRKK